MSSWLELDLSFDYAPFQQKKIHHSSISDRSRLFLVSQKCDVYQASFDKDDDDD